MGLITEDGVTSVSSCKKKTAAAAAGIKRGLIITSINGVKLKGKDHEKIMQMLRNAGLLITLGTKPKPKKAKEAKAPKEEPKEKRGSIGFDKAANAITSDGGTVKQNPMFNAEEENDGFGVPGQADGDEGFGFDDDDRNAYRDVAPAPEADGAGYLEVAEAVIAAAGGEGGAAEPEEEPAAEPEEEPAAEPEDEPEGFGGAEEPDLDEPEGFGGAEEPDSPTATMDF
jgi:hypothetical protein